MGNIPPDNDRRSESRTVTPEQQYRSECYDRVRDSIKARVKHYYHEHPEYITDDRGRKGQDVLILMLRDIFTILNDYIIMKR